MAISLPKWVLLIAMQLLLKVSDTAMAASPIPGPDLDTCQVFVPWDDPNAGPMDCCFLDRPIVDFEFQPHLPMRVRKPAHKMDEGALEKYRRAVALMKALPKEDPRSFAAQGLLHCTYCVTVYNILNSTAPFQVHFGSLFPIFHRFYVYFHERILASLIGDDTLAIPYWAWDVQNQTSPPANIIPPIFTDPDSPLFDKMRSAAHQPPCRVDLELVWTDKVHNKPYDELVRFNNHQIWRNIVADSKSPEVFYGGDIANMERTMGSFETFHVPIHYWTGSDKSPGRDMAPAYTAAMDPIFFAHHTQTDRLFEMWRDLGGGYFDDEEWLDSKFLFYDEWGNLVRVSLRDALDMDKLRYMYEQTPAEWMDYVPSSIRKSGDGKYARSGALTKVWNVVRGGDVRGALRSLGQALFPARETATVALGGGRRTARVTARVKRAPASEKRTIRVRRKSNAPSPADVVEEVLVIGVKVTKPFAAKFQFHVFVELPEADETTPRDCAEYFGPVIFQPEVEKGASGIVVRESSNKIGLGDRLRMLDAGGKSYLDITFVRDWDSQLDERVKVEFTDLRFEMHHLVATA